MRTIALLVCVIGLFAVVYALNNNDNNNINNNTRHNAYLQSPMSTVVSVGILGVLTYLIYTFLTGVFQQDRYVYMGDRPRTHARTFIIERNGVALA
jgi:hypothetical protein